MGSGNYSTWEQTVTGTKHLVSRFARDAYVSVDMSLAVCSSVEEALALHDHSDIHNNSVA